MLWPCIIHRVHSAARCKLSLLDVDPNGDVSQVLGMLYTLTLLPAHSNARGPVTVHIS